MRNAYLTKNARLPNILGGAFDLYQAQPGTSARPETRIEVPMKKTRLTLAALTLGTSMAFAATPHSVYNPATGIVMPMDQIDFSQLDAGQMAEIIAEMRAMAAEHRAQAQQVLQAHMQEMTPEARAERRAAMQQKMQQNGGNGGGMGGIGHDNY